MSDWILYTSLFFNCLLLLYYWFPKTNLKTIFLSYIIRKAVPNKKLLYYLPYFGDKIFKDLTDFQNARKDIKLNVLKARDLENIFDKLPNKGISHDLILSEVDKVKSNSKKELWKISGAVYIDDNEHLELMKKVNNQVLYTNPLHDLWPQLKKCKSEIISMIKHKYNGNNNVCGTMTSGGTMSILAGMYSYREYYNIKNPQIILSEHAHPSYWKACKYFNLTPIVIKVDETCCMKASDIQTYINYRTICIVVSAPNYASGVCDNIQEIAQLADEYKIGCHVDACLGGGLLPWAKEIVEIPNFDFSVRGVTSISIDTHKYFYSPKGSSVILFKNRQLRNKLTFTKLDWSGGFYVTPEFVGSSSGNHIMDTWASLLAFGDEGFRNKAHGIIKLRQKLQSELLLIPQIQIIGNPQLSVIALTSDTINMHSVQDRLTEKGWYFNSLQNPVGFHFCITSTQLNQPDFVEIFILDLKESLSYPSETSKTCKLYASTASIPKMLFPTLTEEIGQWHVYCEEAFTSPNQLN